MMMFSIKVVRQNYSPASFTFIIKYNQKKEKRKKKHQKTPNRLKVNKYCICHFV